VPAVISVEMPVFDLGFFVEFLTELEGTGKNILSKNITSRENTTLPIGFFLILRVGSCKPDP
jgi:hypothetical protein